MLRAFHVITIKPNAMPNSSLEPELPDLPAVVTKTKRPWAVEIIWIIPIIAILVGLNLAYQTLADRGPTITIAFKSGEGLEAGKTVVKFKGINIGLVQNLVLSEDHQYVIATVQLNQDAHNFTSDNSRFWIVRPRISTSGVSGISTLLSGPFIAAELGTSPTKRDHFVALDVPPIMTAGMAGREFILKAPTLGSHDIGTQVYFRRLTVGEVVAYDLDKDGKDISIKVFIHAPYDKYVTSDTRFWNASGIDVTIGATGIQIQTESLVSVLVGGIAFETLQYNGNSTIRLDTDTQHAEAATTASAIAPNHQANAQSIFPLFQTRNLAMRQPESITQRFTIDFKQSVRGLSIGAPVEFRGVYVGEVVSIGLAFNPKTFEVVQPVEIVMYPELLQARSLITGEMIPLPKTTLELVNRTKAFIDRGLRAQLRNGSLLTGQQYIGIDFFPDAPKYNFDIAKSPLVMQAVPSLFDNLEQSVASLIVNANKMVKRLEVQVLPELSQTLAHVKAVTASDSPLQTDLRDSLREITKAAGSIKNLSNMLDQQPQSLIFGKPQEQSK